MDHWGCGLDYCTYFFSSGEVSPLLWQGKPTASCSLSPNTPLFFLLINANGNNTFLQVLERKDKKPLYEALLKIKEGDHETRLAKWVALT